MSRRTLALLSVTAAVALGVWGCQDYNFNPVGSCLIQPGQRQVPLTGITVADILFVVDDSGSMDSKQQALARNFSTFIDSLATAQRDRVANGLEPFEFHIAVTNSSIFAYDTSFHTSYAATFPSCTQGTAVANGSYPAGAFVKYGTNPLVIHFTKNVAWSAWGVAVPAWLASQAYVVGDQVTNAGNVYRCITAGTSAASGGPTTTASDITDGSAHWRYLGLDPVPLVRYFVGSCSSPAGLCSGSCTGTCSGGNVEVGSCGSGQEQHLEAGRLAVQKALAGQQPGVAPGEWPHANSKMVVVFVGDEDDCSNPPDYGAQTAAIRMTSYSTGNDSCVADKNTASPPAPRVFPDGVLEYPISGSSGYTAFFSGLGRPFGAAFIVAANRCTVPNTYGDECAPADSTYLQSPVSCTGTPQFACGEAFAGGVRHLALARGLKGKGIDVVEGTVCEPFGPILAKIADLVKPVVTLQLGSVPATNDISTLRIINSSGGTQRLCTQETTPGPVADGAAAALLGGWWFASCTDTNNPPAVVGSPTQCVYINHFAAGTSNACEATPGETYSFEYLGQVPPGGCPAPSLATPGPPSQFCAEAVLGPTATSADWASYGCYGDPTATCGGSPCPGTCVCQ